MRTQNISTFSMPCWKDLHNTSTILQQQYISLVEPNLKTQQNQYAQLKLICNYTYPNPDSRFYIKATQSMVPQELERIYIYIYIILLFYHVLRLFAKESTQSDSKSKQYNGCKIAIRNNHQNSESERESDKPGGMHHQVHESWIRQKKKTKRF